jgi:hypothetical protein
VAGPAHLVFVLLVVFVAEIRALAFVDGSRSVPVQVAGQQGRCGFTGTRRAVGPIGSSGLNVEMPIL